MRTPSFLVWTGSRWARSPSATTEEVDATLSLERDVETSPAKMDAAEETRPGKESIIVRKSPKVVNGDRTWSKPRGVQTGYG